MKKRLLSLIITGAMVSSATGLWAQASNQPTIDGVDVGIFVHDNMLYHHFDFASGPLPMRELMTYKKSELYFTNNPYATFGSLPTNSRYSKHIEAEKVLSLGGPMLGNVKKDGIDVWVRTADEYDVKVEVTPKGGGKTILFEGGKTKAKNDLAATISLRGLEAGTTYNYRLLVNGKEVDRNTEFCFTTLPKSDKGITRIAFGGDYHRYGLAHVKQSQTIIDRKPMAMLLTGDIAVQDRENRVGHHCLDFLARDMYPAWQNLSSKVPVYVTWDDHDYLYDDGWNTPTHLCSQDKENIWRIFRNSWVNPQYGFGEEGKGVFLQTTIGAAHVIMLDNRYFRSAGKKGSLLGAEQTQWLKEQLLASKSPFTIITCGTMFSDYVSAGKDSWGVFSPAIREEIFSLIEENQIGGVLLVSGDRHGSRGFVIPRKSGFKFYEFGTGSLGGLGGQPATTPAWKDVQLYGVSSIFAFGEFVFDTSKKDPTVTFSLIDSNTGKTLHKEVLTRSQLTPAKNKK